jgi:AcrR family transcriptional regulator
MEKVDRRVKRTQQLLGDALIALATEKDYEAITIRDITERADVAYVTFFRHYPGKDELLATLLADIIREIEMIAGANHQPFSHEHEGEVAFQHVQANHRLYRVLLTNPGTASVRTRVKDDLAALIGQHLRAHPASEVDNRIPQEIAAHHIAASLLALIEWWLKHDMPYPPQHMAQIYQRFIIAPVVSSEGG